MCVWARVCVICVYVSSSNILFYTCSIHTEIEINFISNKISTTYIFITRAAIFQFNSILFQQQTSLQSKFRGA